MPDVFDMSPALRFGIRRESGPRNAQQFKQFDFLRPTERGAKPYKELTFISSIERWPFPQLFAAKAAPYLFLDSILLVVEAGDLSPFDVYDAAQFGDPSPRTVDLDPDGGPWHFMDFYTSWMAFNRTNVVFKSGWDSRVFAAVKTDAKGLVWSLGANWTSDAGVFTYNGGGNPASTGTLGVNQAAGKEMLVGKLYGVTFTLAGVTGDISITPSIGTTTGTPVTADGTYTQYLRYAGTGNISFAAAGAGIVDMASVSVILQAPSIQTGMAFNESQAVMGGFNPIDMFGFVDWPQYLKSAEFPDGYGVVQCPEFLEDSTQGALNRNWIWWSTVGGGDLLWLFHQNLLLSGAMDGETGFDGERFSFLIDLWTRNEAGARPMPWSGDVGRLLQLGNSIMAYGVPNTDLVLGGGVAALSFSGAFLGMNPVPGLGDGIGIASRCAVGGDEENHLLIDETGEAWMISQSGAQPLRHGDTFRSMLGNEIVISYDQSEKEFYVADGEQAYMLNRNGLSRAPWMPSCISVPVGQGGPLAVLADSQGQEIDEETGIEDVPVTLITEDFSGPGRVPEVESIEIMSSAPNTWTAQLAFKRKQYGAWEYLVPVLFDGRGVAQIKGSGVVFHLTLTNPSCLAADLESIQVVFSDGHRRKLESWQSSL